MRKLRRIRSNAIRGYFYNKPHFCVCVRQVLRVGNFASISRDVIITSGASSWSESPVICRAVISDTEMAQAIRELADEV